MGEPFFDIPPLYPVISLFLGSVLILMPFLWLNGLMSKKHELSFRQSCLHTALRAVYILPVFSLCYGLGKELPAEAFMPEIALISIMSAVYIYRAYRNPKESAEPHHKIRILLDACEGEALRIFGLCFSVAVFVGAVFLVSYTVFLVSVNLNFSNPMEWIVGVDGGFYLLLLLYMHRQVGRSGGKTVEFHVLLWPVALGLLLYIVPLLTYKAAYDPKTYKKFNPPPVLSRV